MKTSAAAKKMKTGTLGCCPVCEGEFKTRDGRLVHHGFTRPGDGMIHGDCFAVGYAPYERTALGCEEYAAACAVTIAEQKRRLAATARVTYYCFEKRGYRETKTFEYALGVTAPGAWLTVVDAKRDEIKYVIKSLENEIARMERRIAEWKLLPLRVVTEEAAVAATKALRDVRAAERAAKDDAKSAKRRALDEKRAAHAAKREVAFTAFVAQLNEIATTKQGEEQTRFALAAWAAFFSPKSKRDLGNLSDFIYEFRKRGLDPLLARLGIATLIKGAWYSYPSWTYYG